MTGNKQLRVFAPSAGAPNHEVPGNVNPVHIHGDKHAAHSDSDSDDGSVYRSGAASLSATHRKMGR